jgi:hypothetical protein
MGSEVARHREQKRLGRGSFNFLLKAFHQILQRAQG